MALTKGYGCDEAINSKLTFFWALVAEVGLHLHIEGVPSSLNIADPVSRRDFSIAQRLGWHSLDVPLDAIYAILLKCAGSLEYAAHQAVRDCLRLRLEPHWLQSLVQDGS